MSELITIEIDSKLPVVKVNFDELKEQATKELEKFQGMVVTEDSVKESKALAAELNKVAKKIDDTRKEYKKQLGEPIVEFESKMNELRDLYKDVHSEITEQTKKFESDRKELALEKVNEFLQQLYLDNDVREPFQKAKVDHLATLGALTPKGALTKKTKDSATGEVNSCLAYQAKIDARLSNLENLCYKAGLQEPLQQHHVQGFLFSDNDEAYNEQVNELIAAEVDRNERMKARMQEQAEADARAKQQAEQQQQQQQLQPTALTLPSGEVMRFKDPDSANAYCEQQGGIMTQNSAGMFFLQEKPVEQQQFQPSTQHSRMDIIGQNGNDGDHYEHSGYAGVDTHVEPTPQQGNIIVMVNALFKVELPASVPDSAIEAKFKSQLASAGFTTLDSIGIVRK